MNEALPIDPCHEEKEKKETIEARPMKQLATNGQHVSKMKVETLYCMFPNDLIVKNRSRVHTL